MSFAGFPPDELQEAVRAVAERRGPRGERAQQIADLVRTATGRRWVGVYEVSPTEVINLAWSGPAPPAHVRLPAEQGLTGAAISARETVVSTMSQATRATSRRSYPPARR